jgi:23S rRNA (uracil-5-)-methyltransferase RumA
MKERILIQGTVSEVFFPNKGKVIPTEKQPPLPEADFLNGIRYKAPSENAGPFYIKNVLPGQTVLASLGSKGKRSREGYLLQTVAPAPYEIDAACPHAGICGGCRYQTVPYERQLAWKDHQVHELLRDIPGIVSVIADGRWLPIQPSPLSLEYRNKMEFSFGDAYKDGPLTLGLHKQGAFHDIVATPGCRLVHPDLRKILVQTANHFRAEGATYYHTHTHEGWLRHLVLRRSFQTGGILVNLVTSSQAALPLDGWVDALLRLPLEGGRITGILHTVNDTMGDVVQKDSMDLLYGCDTLTESLLGLTFAISPFSFFQTNSLGAEELYRIVRRMAGDVSRQHVFDLYCGTGTIAQIIAAAGAAQVTGIELVEEAAEAARRNAARNALEHCSFLAGDVLNLVGSLPDKPDLIILDPPRDGCHPKALPKILAFAPDRFIYVSCKPTSLARDLPFFLEAGYQVQEVQCCDMFPMTPGVETVVSLTKAAQ